MTARNLAFTAAALAAATALLVPTAHAAAPPNAQGSGLLGGLNQLLGGTVGTIVDQGGELLGQVDPTGGTLTSAGGTVLGTVDAATGQLFDTTGTLLGTIDTTTGTVLDPVGNVIGVLIPTTGTGGGGGGGTPGSPTTPGNETGSPTGGSGALSMALTAARAQRFTTVARRGVSAATSCSSACGVLAALTVDGRTAKRLGLGRGTQPVVVGTAVAAPGRMAIRVTSRTRRALSRALPSRRVRTATRSKRIRAQRLSRSRSATAAQRRAAARRVARYRKTERRWISSGRVKLTVAAVGMDPRGRTTTIRRQSLVVKR